MEGMEEVVLALYRRLQYFLTISDWGPQKGINQLQLLAADTRA